MVSGNKSQGSAALGNGDAGTQADNNPSGTREEKMKVVVRVRPLQAKEESWPKTAADNGPDTSVPATITIQVARIRAGASCWANGVCGRPATTGKRSDVGEEWSAKGSQGRRCICQRSDAR